MDSTGGRHLELLWHIAQQVFEGEHHITDKNRKLGEFSLTGIKPGPAVRNSQQMWQYRFTRSLLLPCHSACLPMVQFSDPLTSVLLVVIGKRDRQA
jgi:molecular chaperone DnaK (HSP70)